jgi:ribosomal protein S18 acetylase RimI-like enzyme
MCTRTTTDGAQPPRSCGPLWTGPRTRDAASVWLGVNSQNAKAIRFYEKSGFTKVGTKSFTLGDSVESDFILECPLPGKG